VTNYDLLFRHPLQLFAKAAEVGVTRACRELGLLGSHIHRRAGYSEWRRMTVRIFDRRCFSRSRTRGFGASGCPSDNGLNCSVNGYFGRVCARVYGGVAE
jgi:hypothetical protein